MISPATAFSTFSLDSAINCVTLLNLTALPVRANLIDIPRSNSPEMIRTNAIRSRCRGSILACILNTNPENSGIVGNTTSLVSVLCPCGSGA